MGKGESSDASGSTCTAPKPPTLKAVKFTRAHLSSTGAVLGAAPAEYARGGEQEEETSWEHKMHVP